MNLTYTQGSSGRVMLARHGSTSANIMGVGLRGHSYWFIWKDGRLKDVLRTLYRYSTDPELDFHWCDAIVVKEMLLQMLVEIKGLVASQQGT